MVARGVPTGEAHYVPTFPTIEAAAPVARADLATPADATVLLALSRLHEKKGLDVLLRALAELPGCVAWIAGDGPLEGDLKALAARLGVADRVRFLGWRNDRGALLRAADICVLPSRWEPFGTVMLEAWAAGTPLVAAASQGPAALIEDGGNGLLVPVDDAPALAAAIRRLMADPALRAHLIERGRADYQQGFTREAVTERMLALYRQLIAESERGHGRGREGRRMSAEAQSGAGGIVTAALLVIGDEILSGRTKDKNIGHIADHLTAIGIQMKEVRIVPDEEPEIVDAVNALRKRYDYVFTTGGIGPTHDDITADAIAKAFGVGIDVDERALAPMRAYFQRRGVELTPARMRMARIPFGAELVENSRVDRAGLHAGQRHRHGRHPQHHARDARCGDQVPQDRQEDALRRHGPAPPRGRDRRDVRRPAEALPRRAHGQLSLPARRQARHAAGAALHRRRPPRRGRERAQDPARRARLGVSVPFR